MIYALSIDISYIFQYIPSYILKTNFDAKGIGILYRG